MEWPDLTKQEREDLEQRLASYLHAERPDEGWNTLAVRLLADCIAEQIGPIFFNRGIDAALHAAHDAGERLEVNMEAQKRTPPPPPSGRREQRPAERPHPAEG